MTSDAGSSQETPARVLVAVAWPYASGPRHIGHVAGFGVPSDIFARYHRLRGNNVLMVSGTDEHGTPIMVAADREGVAPKELADRFNGVIRDDLRALGLSYDLFTRTTTSNHYRVTQDMFRTLWEQGYLSSRRRWAPSRRRRVSTLPDRYIEGTCPICGYRGRTRRPVRQLREPARSGRPDRAPLEASTGATARLPGDEAFLPRSPRVRGPAREWISRQTHWRSNVRASR